MLEKHKWGLSAKTPCEAEDFWTLIAAWNCITNIHLAAYEMTSIARDIDFSKTQYNSFYLKSISVVWGAEKQYEFLWKWK